MKKLKHSRALLVILPEALAVSAPLRSPVLSCNTETKGAMYITVGLRTNNL